MCTREHGWARLTAGLAVLMAGVLGAPAAMGAVLYVDDDAPPGGDGAGWTTAYRFLRDALAFAANPDHGITEIRIAGGTYRPDEDELNPTGTGDREAAFALVDGLALLGGYAGLAGPDPDARDLQRYETVFSGDLDGDDGPGGTNIAENSHTLVTGFNLLTAVSLDGLTFTGANADCEGVDFDPCYLGGGVYVDDVILAVTRCTFRQNAAEWGGGLYVYESEVEVGDCLFLENRAATAGGLRINQSFASLDRCVFVGNLASNGGGLAVRGTSTTVTITDSEFNDNDASGAGGAQVQHGSIVLSGCRFVGNTADLGAAMMTSLGAETTMVDCLFSHNEASLSVGAVSAGGPVSLTNCAFVRNRTSGMVGGIVTVFPATLVNCMFSQCQGDRGAAMFVGDDSSLVNCTVSDSNGSGIMALGGATAELSNCILWGNSEGALVEDPDVPGAVFDVRWSDVQGGWPGPGNIDADPLFVQPGTDDLRLSFGSPCVDAGNNSAVPPGITTDLAGGPRIQGGVVDMGAYEGEFEPGPPAAEDTDLDGGDFVVLVPGGGDFDPMVSPCVIVSNHSGPDDASFTVSQLSVDSYPPAGGYDTLALILASETTLADGEFTAILFVPFDEEDLEGVDPLHVNLTHYDPAVGNWSLAVAGNTVPSPGFDGPIGNRIMVDGGGGWGPTDELGDYGVYWDPVARQGCAWANVDHAADFGLGIALCPADCRQTPDGQVSVIDLLAMLAAWGAGAGGGPCDVDVSGVVDASDFEALVTAWGACPQRSAVAAPAPVAGLAGMDTTRWRTSEAVNGESVVAIEDLLTLLSRWGAGEACSP
jgi:hypothetical protein